VLHFWPEGIFKGLQSFLLQVYITEIIVHKADEPDAVVDLFDADGLASQAAAEIDLLAIKAQSAASAKKSWSSLQARSPRSPMRHSRKRFTSSIAMLQCSPCKNSGHQNWFSWSQRAVEGPTSVPSFNGAKKRRSMQFVSSTLPISVATPIPIRQITQSSG
jgi:hypothetical protein